MEVERILGRACAAVPSAATATERRGSPFLQASIALRRYGAATRNVMTSRSASSGARSRHPSTRYVDVTIDSARGDGAPYGDVASVVLCG